VVLLLLLLLLLLQLLLLLLLRYAEHFLGSAITCTATPAAAAAAVKFLLLPTMIEAGKGGKLSRAVTVSASTRPNADPSGTVSLSSTGVCCSTVACASGMLIIL
jgi:hypothetical protein